MQAEYLFQKQTLIGSFLSCLLYLKRTIEILIKKLYEDLGLVKKY